MTMEEAREAIAEIKKNTPKAINVECEYSKYHPSGNKQKEIIAQAKRLYLGGKHLGSKPLGKIKARITSINKQIDRYSKTFTAAENLRKQAEQENKVEVENVD